MEEEELDWGDDVSEEGEIVEAPEQVQQPPPSDDVVMNGTAPSLDSTFQAKFHSLSGLMRQPFQLTTDANFDNFMMTLIHYATFCNIFPSMAHMEPESLTAELLNIMLWYAHYCRREAMSLNGFKDEFKDLIAETKAQLLKDPERQHQLITMQDLEQLMRSSDMPAEWLHWRDNLRSIITGLEQRRFHNEGLGVEWEIPDREDDLSISKQDSLKIRDYLRRSLDWLPFTLHPGMFWNSVAIFNDGSNAWRMIPVCKALDRVVSDRKSHKQVARFFREPQGRDAPSKRFPIYNDDFIFSKDPNRSEFPFGRLEYTPCGLYLDGKPFGASGDLFEDDTSRSTSRGDRFATVNVDDSSQNPTLKFKVADGHGAPCVELVLFPQACELFDVRILPIERSRAESSADALLSAHEEEVKYQWPGLNFHARDSRRQGQEMFAIEIVAEMRKNHGITLAHKSATPSEVLKDNGGAREVYDAMRQAQRIQIVVHTSGQYTRGCWEWFRMLINSGKRDSMDGTFRCLWMYQQSLRVSNVDELINDVISGVKGPSIDRRYPAVPVHLLREKDNSRMVSFPPQKSFSTITELVATHVLGTARAMQHHELEHYVFGNESHQGRYQITDVHNGHFQVRWDITLRKRSYARQLPPLQASIRFSSSTRGDRRSILSQQGQRVPTTNSIGVDISIVCTLDEIQVKEFQNFHRDRTVFAVRFQVPRQDQSFIESLDKLRDLLAYRPNWNEFDLPSQLMQTTGSEKFVLDPLSEAQKDTTAISGVVQKLRDGLDDSQSRFFEASIGGLQNGYLDVQGPPGSGKSATTAKVAIALSLCKKVLVTTQTNDSLDAILSKVLEVLHGFPDADSCSRGQLEQLRICRVYPKAHERKIAGLSVLERRDEIPQMNQCDEQEWMFQRYHHLKMENVALARLVDKYAAFTTVNRSAGPDRILADEQSIPERKQNLANQYLALYKHCRNLMYTNVPNADGDDLLRDFDGVVEDLGALLLREMSIVFATLDQCPRVLQSFQPDMVLMDEVGTITLPQALKAFSANHPPQGLISIGDKLQLGPVIPSGMDHHNEFHQTMEVPFVQLLEPTLPEQHIVLQTNYRNPPSIWEFCKKKYAERGAHVTSLVDISKGERSGILRQVELHQDEDRFFFGALKRQDLHANQQFWFTLPDAHMREEGERDLALVDVDRSTKKILTTTGSSVAFKPQNSLEYINDGTRLAVCHIVWDLITVAGIPASQILVQSTSAEDARELKNMLRQRNSQDDVDVQHSLNVKSTTSAQGGENMIVVTHVAVCGCKIGATMVPKDQTTNVALTRAKMFHFVVGNLECLENGFSKKNHPKSVAWFKEFLEHVRDHDQVKLFNLPVEPRRELAIATESSSHEHRQNGRKRGRSPSDNGGRKGRRSFGGNGGEKRFRHR